MPKFDISDILEANSTLRKFKITGTKEHLYEFHLGYNIDVSPSCSCPDFME